MLVGAIRLLDRILAPLVAALLWIAEKQSPKSSEAGSADAVSERELLQIADEAAAAGHIESSDAELIEQSFTLGDLNAADVLVRLDDVVSISHDTPVAEALEAALHTGHRQLPVHRLRPDEVLGITRLRDLAAGARTDPAAPIEDYVLEPVTVSADTPVLDVLRQMQTAHHQLAIVVDPSGAAIGIVTADDILEEFLGSIVELPSRPGREGPPDGL